MLAVDAGEIAFPRRRSLPFTFRHVAATVHLTDAALIVATSVVTGCAYRWSVSGVLGEVDQYMATGVLVAVLIFGVNSICGFTRPGELFKRRKQAKAVTVAWVFALVIVLGMAFAWKVSSDFSRGAFVTFFAAGFSVMLVDRLLWYHLLQNALKRESLKVRHVAILFRAEQDRDEMEVHLANLRRYGLIARWQFALPSDGSQDVEGMSQRLIEMLRGTSVEEVIILADWKNVATLVDVEKLRHLPIPLRYLPVGSARDLCERPREIIGGSLLVELQRGSLSGKERLAKAAFDRCVAALALLALVPVFVVCAALISLDSRGPVFFRQTRRGFNGRPFQIWKFRTMRVAENGQDVRQAVVGDSRVTRVGRLLRRTSIDELPQLINVLRGEMSIVGPRPHALVHDDHYDQRIAEYPRRQHVLPGLTGWAQVRGARGETPTIEHMARRVELDVWYVQNWSFRQDLWIILSTIGHVLTGKNAY